MVRIWKEVGNRNIVRNSIGNVSGRKEDIGKALTRWLDQVKECIQDRWMRWELVQIEE